MYLKILLHFAEVKLVAQNYCRIFKQQKVLLVKCDFVGSNRREKKLQLRLRYRSCAPSW